MVLKEAENKDVENWLVKPYELLPRVGILRSCDNCEKTFDIWFKCVFLTEEYLINYQQDYIVNLSD